MSGGGALNLSLLSRGIGEVQKNGHEKVEVVLEPSDYYNFGGTERPYYLPPIQPAYHFAETSPRITTRSARDASEIPLPKTFTTRKGALLLFSEDMALKTIEKEQQKKAARHRHHPFHASFPPPDSLNEDETAIVLKTVDDLAKSILQYGSSTHRYHDDDNQMYLKFIHRRREQWERQIRPGYSAKRYLSTWTKNWDDQVFENVVSKGYLTERSLFHYNLFLPHLRRHLFHEDLSNMPQPYRLMKNMLLTPGSLSGYTFFREPDFGALIEEEEEGADGQMIRRPDTKRSIRVIRTNQQGLAREVSYSALDRDTQKEVITDLLVKSAVHYALSKQEEILEESLARTVKSGLDDDSATSYDLSVSRKTPAEKSVPGFDMRNAVDSLLDTQRGPLVLGADLPDSDGQSHTSERSFKGSSLPQHAVKSMGARQTPRAHWPGSAESGGSKDKEFMGDAPVAAIREASASSSHSHSSVPQLPHISRQPLSPIRDVSRETSQLVTLPPIHKDGQEDGKKGGMPKVQVMPATPQVAQTTPRDLHRVVEADSTDTGVHRISNESSPAGSGVVDTHRSDRKGKAKGLKAGARSLAAGSGESRSIKGSMIMAPDGEIISVGGSVAAPRPHDVGVISDVSLPQRQFDVNMTDESGVSDDEPDEWRPGRKRKPRTLSSKRSVGKRESETSIGSGAKSVISSEKEGKETGSGKSVAIIRPGVATKEPDRDSLASASIQIDYTSGDIDATVSIHSWSYGAKGEEGENGLVKAGSFRSLPGLSNDGASQTGRSSVTEQDILDTLTTHAKRIAESVLSNNEAGQDLEDDVRGAIQEIMHAQQENDTGAGPSSDEYKDLIRQSLTTAVAKAAGLDPEQIPEDAEISPDLLEALASQKLTPEDIAIIQDEETGRPVIKSRHEITHALGGVAQGHIFVAPNGKAGSIAGSDVGMKRQMSIPADRASLVDNMEYDVISYGGTEVMSERGRAPGKSKAGSKAGSIAGGTVADLKEHLPEHPKVSEDSTPEADEFAQRLQQIDQEKDTEKKKSPSPKSPPKEEPKLPDDGSPVKLDLDRQSEKSAKTGVSQKTEKSEDSKKKEKKVKTPEEPFVVGAVDHKAELSKLYGAQGPGTLPSAKLENKSPVKGKKPKKEEKKEKTKSKKGTKSKSKKGKKEEEATPEATPTEEPPAPEPPAPEPVVEAKVPTPQPVVKEPEPPKPMTASSSERLYPSSPELTRMATDDEMEFNIVREESSPEPDPPQKPNIPAPYPDEEDEDEDEEEDIIEDNGDELRSISNREARAAKRAAAAAKRKEEVEKRRREREEQLKKEKEEQERQEQLKKEMEDERRRREEERRLRKQREAEEKDNEERAQEEAERKKRLAEERERRAKEEYQRKLEEMRRKQVEEEARKMELLLQKQREEEERRAQEELMMSQMAEQERLEYQRKKKEEEEERKKREEEERLKREEEARKAMGEAQRLAEEMAKKQAELEARLKFNRTLQTEATGLDQSHDINRAFVFSYFELLQWLGLDIPEFELAKMNQL